MMQNSLKELGLSEEDVLNAPKVLRTHCYCMNPKMYDIQCSICGGVDITWSEYESHIWCFNCQKDIFLTGYTCGIFSGPIPVEVSNMLGIKFDRINLQHNEIITKVDFNNQDELLYWNKTWVRDSELEEYKIKIDNKIKHFLNEYTEHN